MTKLLHIIASPRGANSKSNALAATYVEAAKAKNPDLEIDVLDLFAEDLPAFDGDPAAAKMTFFGDGVMDDSKQAAWDKVAEITNRFISADHYVLGVPMWNGGVPYRLKHYIDIITQPGLLFGFDPEAGYSGLLQGKTARVFYTSGVYAPGAPAKYGQDFQSTYLTWWLNFVGITQVQDTRFQPSLLTADPAAAQQEAVARSAALATTGATVAA